MSSADTHAITSMISYRAMAARYNAGIVSRLTTSDQPIKAHGVHLAIPAVMKTQPTPVKSNGKSIIVVDGD